MTKRSDSRRQRRLAKQKQARQVRPRLEILEDRVVPAVFTVTSTADTGGAATSGTLRQVLNEANLGGTNTIVFSSSVSGTLALGSALPVIKAGTTLTIDDSPSAVALGGAIVPFTINGGGFHNEVGVVSGASLTIHGGNNSVGTGGLTFTKGAGVLIGPSDVGGGAFINFGTLSIDHTNIKTNIAANTAANANARGAAVYNAGTLTLDTDILTGNTVSGLFVGLMQGGAVFNTGNATLTNDILTGNTASNLLVLQRYGGRIGRP
jgi:hypothetical protein